MSLMAIEGAGKEMRAVVIDRFGGPEVLSVRDVPVPEIGPDQVLIRVDSAGVGKWDIAEREGTLAKASGIMPKFPWVLGTEGAGKVVAVGEKVDRFRIGDLVYAHVWATNPKAGFYAEYTPMESNDAFTYSLHIDDRKSWGLAHRWCNGFEGPGQHPGSEAG